MLINQPIFNFYSKLLQKNPLTTRAFTGGAFFSLGDALAQFAFEKGDFNWKRNGDFFIMGFAYIAPALHMWFGKLLPKIQASLFSTASKSVKVLGSMCCEQLVFAPIVMSAFFPINQMVMDRDIRSFQKGITTLKEKIQITMINNWKLWPIASTINIWFVPMQYQVLYTNFIGLFWNMIMSSITWQ